MSDRSDTVTGTEVPLPAWATGSVGRVWFGMRLQLLAAGARQLARTPVKAIVLIVMWGLLAAGLFAMAEMGMQFVNRELGLGPFFLGRVWYLLLFVLMVLLAVSQLASAYSTLVRGPDVPAWMVFPLTARTLCRIKWAESSFYSAWAMLFMAAPLALAYVHVLNRPLWLAAWMVGALMLPLLGLVTALSSLALLAWLRWCGGWVVRRELLAVGLAVVGVAVFWILGEQYVEEDHEAWFLILQDLLPRMEVAMAGWLPSRWAAVAFDAAIGGRWAEAGRYTALLWATALAAWRLMDHAAAVWLFPVLRRHVHPGTFGSASVPAGKEQDVPAWSAHPAATALAKEGILLVRDPVQWSQGLLFFGLLGAYYANMHRLGLLSIEPSWRLGMTALNLACTLLVLSSLAYRFVFPQLSLEGRCLWLLRTLPGGLRRILMAKLTLYGALSVAIIEGLLLLSGARLGVEPGMRVWLLGVGAIAALTIIGIAVGMGAWLVDPSAHNAAHVVSSSAGAVVLVALLAYVACVIGALLFTWTLWVEQDWGRVPWVAAALTAISIAAAGLPLWCGLRKAQRIEKQGY